MHDARREAHKYLIVGCTYTALYVTVDRISFVHMLPGTGLTLWNPSPAVSLALLLTKGLRFAPVLFPAAVLADGVNDGFAVGLMPTLVMNVIIAVGYTTIAAVLRPFASSASGFSGMRDLTWFLGIVGAGVLAIAALTGTALVLMHALPPERLRAVIRHFWVGDVTGVVGLFPVLMTAPLAWKRWKESPARTRLLDPGVFVLALALALWVVFGVAHGREPRFFYPLLLPIIWIGARHGLPWCALAILAEQVALIGAVIWHDFALADVADFHIFLLAIAATGLVLGAVVTERQGTELRLRRQQAELARMARLTTAGALGSAIVHEISQPLATVATYAHACRLLLKSELHGHGFLAETLAKLESETLRAGEIVERLRDFLSKGGARPMPVNFADVVHRVVATLGDEARSHGVNVFVDVQPVVPIATDRLQMEQVLLNLIRNGIEAAAESGARERRVRICLRRSGDGLCVDVEDNGPGISPGIAEHLFEPFATGKPRGLGLGLVLSRQIIEVHGGELWCDRTVAAGARFTFRLRRDGSKPDAG